MMGYVVRELTLPQLLSYIRSSEMPTKSATPVKSSKKSKAATEDDEEEEEPVKKTKVKKGTAEVSTKKTKTASKTKAAESKNGKVATAKKKTKAPAVSARDVVLKVLVAGAPRTEIKSRARKLAEEEGAEISLKTFDVSFFIRYLVEKKGYTAEEKKKAGTIKLIPPKAEKKGKAAKA